MRIPKAPYQRQGLFVRKLKGKGRAVFTPFRIYRGGGDFCDRREENSFTKAHEQECSARLLFSNQFAFLFMSARLRSSRHQLARQPFVRWKHVSPWESTLCTPRHQDW